MRQNDFVFLPRVRQNLLSFVLHLFGATGRQNASNLTCPNHVYKFKLKLEAKEKKFTFLEGYVCEKKRKLILSIWENISLILE